MQYPPLVMMSLRSEQSWLPAATLSAVRARSRAIFNTRPDFPELPEDIRYELIRDRLFPPTNQSFPVQNTARNVPHGGISRPGDIPGYDFPDVRRRRQFRERFGIGATAGDDDALQRVLEAGGFGAGGDGGDALDGDSLPRLPANWGQNSLRRFEDEAKKRFTDATSVLERAWRTHS